MFGGDWHSDFSFLAGAALAHPALRGRGPALRRRHPLVASMERAFADPVARACRNERCAASRPCIADTSTAPPGRPPASCDQQLDRHQPQQPRSRPGDRPPGRAPPPGLGPRGALRQPDLHHPVRGHDRGRKPGSLLEALYRHAARPEFTCRVQLAGRHPWPCGTTARRCTTRSTTTTASTGCSGARQWRVNGRSQGREPREPLRVSYVFAGKTGVGAAHLGRPPCSAGSHRGR